MYGSEQKSSKVAIFCTLFTFPITVTKINFTLVVPLTFMINYVTVINTCDNSEKNCIDVHDYIEFNGKDIFIVVILYVLDEIIYVYFMKVSHFTTVKIIKFNKDCPLFTDFYSIFCYFKERLCTKNLAIIVKHFFRRNAMFNIFYVLGCIYQVLYCFDHNTVDACKEKFSESSESCNMLDERIERVDLFFDYVIISGIIFIIYMLIVLILLHFKKVDKLFLTFLFGLTEECEMEDQIASTQPVNSTETDLQLEIDDSKKEFLRELEATIALKKSYSF